MRDHREPEGPGDGGALPWEDALTAAALLAVDPGLGGAVLRARAGPARDAWLDAARALGGLTPLRLPVGGDDGALDGGIDLAATLAAGRPIVRAGLLDGADDRLVVLPMAERAAPGLAARLARSLDAGGHRRVLVALDEGAGPDEAAPDALADRLAFRPDLGEIALGELTPPPWPAPALAAARRRLDRVGIEAGTIERLVALAVALGIGSLRAPVLAVRAARAAAALEGEPAAGARAEALAARLVLGPRATRLPATEEAVPSEPPEGAPPDGEPSGEDRAEPDTAAIPEEVLLEAARAAIPAGLLARLLAGAGSERRRRAAGAGDDEIGYRRGRPAGTVARAPRDGARVALVDTLRAAAPWQRLRRGDAEPCGRVLVRPGDIRLRRFRRQAERVAIFAVDASGSTAMARLAEAKGAIEIMLAEAYAGRDAVALVAFRGKGAELLLPPTRGLVAAKRRLAGLPGGGGTPLAAGLAEALAVAGTARAKGLVPTIALLTDGRANVARDGNPGRPQAEAEALVAAGAVRQARVAALVIDTGNRPSAPARALAGAMGAAYLPLPRADARALAGAVRAVAG